MNTKSSPGMRIVDIKTNEAVGVFDKDGQPLMNGEYITKRLAAQRGHIKARNKEVK